MRQLASPSCPSELRAVICDRFQNRHGSVVLGSDTVEQFNALVGRTGVGLDHVEDAPGGVVFDGQHLLTMLVAVSIHVDGYTSVLSFKPYTHGRPVPACSGSRSRVQTPPRLRGRGCCRSKCCLEPGGCGQSTLRPCPAAGAVPESAVRDRQNTPHVACVIVSPAVESHRCRGTV